jgi:hypothetical protein
MNIATFITHYMEEILVEWEAFATTFGAVADRMSSLELRDHAKQILEFVARDIQEVQDEQQTEAKSKGHGPEAARDDSASMTHGELRYASGFTMQQVIAEYRALRASVLKLWEHETHAESDDPLRQVMKQSTSRLRKRLSLMRKKWMRHEISFLRSLGTIFVALWLRRP